MIWILSVAAVLGLAGLAYSKSSSADSGQQGRIVHFKAADLEMNEAKKLARETLPLFFARFAEPADDEDDFILKYDIDPTGEAEYVWAGLLSRSGTTLEGVLLNNSTNTNGKEGDLVTFQEAEVIDWSYRKGGVVAGNFTTRVMLKRMPEDEAAKHRAFLGW